MSLLTPNSLEAFHWEPQPGAQNLVREIVDGLLSRCPGASDVARRMKDDTGTRFIDWVEAIFVPDSESIRQKLTDVGYVKFRDRTAEFARIFAQPQGIFPRIVLHDAKITAAHLKVTHVADFAAAWQLADNIEGEPGAPYRRVRAFAGNDCELWIAERWGWTGFELPPEDLARNSAAMRLLEAFRARKRDFDIEADGFTHAIKLIDLSRLNIDLKCALFFEAERDYWQRRNHAAQVQWARQQTLGLGWGNHDHHTYRSSREQFKNLVAVWEKLGFVSRERFYAGREAGWGAQVMEQPYAGIVTFNDVDLSPEELMGDFGHDGLKRMDKLGTVGLWCALHGEAFLQAGMHHLEAQFDFDSLRDQLQTQGVKTMKPFTNFPYLRQAFTDGQRWPVDPVRIKRLVAANQVTNAQAQEFRAYGALGSHLENLERNDGFKGFNQTGVSEIISATDPRKNTYSA